MLGARYPGLKGQDCVMILIAMIAIFSWVNHVVSCVFASQWGLLALGAMIFPVGVVNGFGSWFGFW